MQGAHVLSLVREIRSHILRSVGQKKKGLKGFHVPPLESIDEVADGELNLFESFCFLPPQRFCTLPHNTSMS